MCDSKGSLPSETFRPGFRGGLWRMSAWPACFYPVPRGPWAASFNALNAEGCARTNIPGWSRWHWAPPGVCGTSLPFVLYSWWQEERTGGEQWRGRARMPRQEVVHLACINEMRCPLAHQVHSLHPARCDCPSPTCSSQGGFHYLRWTLTYSSTGFSCFWPSRTKYNTLLLKSISLLA